MVSSRSSGGGGGGSANRGASSRGGGGGSSGFQYRKRAQGAVNERMQRYQQGNRDTFVVPGTEMFKAKVGENWIRVMPPTWDDPQHYAYEVWVHYEVGPDNSTYLCPRKMKGEECGICAELEEARNSGDNEYADKLEPGLRLAAWIIDREDERKGVQLWLYSARMDQEILEQAYDRHTGETIMIDDPKDGYDLEFRRTGEKLQTRYTGMKLTRKPSEVADTHLQFVVKNPLPTVLKFYSNDHIMTAFAGKPPTKTPDAEEERVEDTKQDAKREEPRREPQREEPKREAASTATAARRQRGQQATQPDKTDFTKLSLEQQLDHIDQHQIALPDSVPDEGVGKWMNENVPGGLNCDIPF